MLWALATGARVPFGPPYRSVANPLAVPALSDPLVQTAEAATGQPTTELPPEQHFPVPLFGLHGLLALTTLVLVLLTALGVGDQGAL